MSTTVTKDAAPSTVVEVATGSNLTTSSNGPTEATTTPENLVTVCWYHHHVAIHMLGMTIDPDSPLHRRRLIGLYNHDPPGSAA